jgi:ABC-type glycerol-3-phosphate transport system permease component
MIVPLFIYAFRLGLLDSRFALIAVYSALNIPFAFWLLNGFFNTVPGEIIDSALVDGCGEVSALWHVVLPVVRPGLISAATFAFLLAWNDFALASVLTTSSAKTLPLLINSFNTGNGVAWGPMAAATTLAILPPVILMFAVRRWFVAGLTAGAVKG